LGKLMRGLAIAVLVAAGVVVALFLTKWLERLVDGLMLRIGSVWTLSIVAGVTLVLAAMWLRHGGVRVVRWWGIVLKPAPPKEGAAGAGPTERRPPLVGPRS
jgi:hypothetical protein